MQSPLPSVSDRRNRPTTDDWTLHTTSIYIPRDFLLPREYGMMTIRVIVKDMNDSAVPMLAGHLDDLSTSVEQSRNKQTLSSSLLKLKNDLMDIFDDKAWSPHHRDGWKYSRDDVTKKLEYFEWVCNLPLQTDAAPDCQEDQDSRDGWSHEH
jgi:hypothetical protein